jgi:4,4'-diaponeurosporenoate glycosyltransferase
MDGAVGALIWLAGHAAGWWLWRRLPRFRAAADPDRAPVSVVVPARDEERNIAACVAALHARSDDEVIVVDDESRDATADLARAAGATVLRAGARPEGWMGKPWACHRGASVATRDVVVMVDADVRLSPGALDALATMVRRHPGRLASVQPWHAVERPGEHAAMLFNLLAIMAARPLGRRQPLAFGPVLACSRDRYLELGGHGHPSVRGALVEDLALGLLFGDVASHVADPAAARYRMYPDGAKGVVRGFTRSIGAGLGRTDPLVTGIAVAWCASLGGGLFVSPWLWIASALQVLVLSRRAGRFGAVGAALYPLHLALFTATVVRSTALRAVGGSIEWRGRRVAVR